MSSNPGPNKVTSKYTFYLLLMKENMINSNVINCTVQLYFIYCFNNTNKLWLNNILKCLAISKVSDAAFNIKIIIIVALFFGGSSHQLKGVLKKPLQQLQTLPHWVGGNFRTHKVINSCQPDLAERAALCKLLSIDAGFLSVQFLWSPGTILAATVPRLAARP